jgi:hypothetical protein
VPKTPHLVGSHCNKEARYICYLSLALAISLMGALPLIISFMVLHVVVVFFFSFVSTKNSL